MMALFLLPAWARAATGRRPPPSGRSQPIAGRGLESVPSGLYSAPLNPPRSPPGIVDQGSAPHREAGRGTRASKRWARCRRRPGRGSPVTRPPPWAPGRAARGRTEGPASVDHPRPQTHYAPLPGCPCPGPYLRTSWRARHHGPRKIIRIETVVMPGTLHELYLAGLITVYGPWRPPAARPAGQSSAGPDPRALAAAGKGFGPFRDEPDWDPAAPPGQGEMDSGRPNRGLMDRRASPPGRPTSRPGPEPGRGVVGRPGGRRIEDLAFSVDEGRAFSGLVPCAIDFTARAPTPRDQSPL